MATVRAKPKQCKDCLAEGILTKRKAPHPGPRCATHHRAKRKDRRNYSHATHIMELYGLSSEEYMKIYEYQDGTCAICKRARGLRKKLSVDHDHATGEVRGLLCQKCNRDVLGHLRDDVNALYRAADYLMSPPARQALGGIRIVPEDGAPIRGPRDS